MSITHTPNSELYRTLNSINTIDSTLWSVFRYSIIIVREGASHSVGAAHSVVFGQGDKGGFRVDLHSQVPTLACAWGMKEEKR